MNKKYSSKQNMTDEVKANRGHKDSVFSLLFSDPDTLRELYSAIEGIDLPPDTPVDINTLSDALFKGRINDLSFLIDNRLVVLIEHQSTINENMPVRLLIYIAEVYKKILDRRKVFQEKLLEIPAPEFIVLYNGSKPHEDYLELSLSDAFKSIEGLKAANKANFPLELTVQVYNINKGHNPQLLEKSETLGGYSIFTDKIREYKNMDFSLEESIRAAVKYCLENNILRDFLNAYGSEVMNMILEDLTADEWLEVRYEEGVEQGLEQGVEIGQNKEREYVLELINQGLTNEEIRQHLEQKLK